MFKKKNNKNQINLGSGDVLVFAVGIDVTGAARLEFKNVKGFKVMESAESAIKKDPSLISRIPDFTIDFANKESALVLLDKVMQCYLYFVDNENKKEERSTLEGFRENTIKKIPLVIDFDKVEG